jgi:hypothetical protein
MFIVHIFIGNFSYHPGNYVMSRDMQNVALHASRILSLYYVYV